MHNKQNIEPARRIRMPAIVALGAALLITLPQSASQVNCGAVRVADTRIAQNSELKWCCCGACCGWAKNCKAVPGCTTCR